MTESHRLAVLGAGHVGPVIARLAISAGYPVAIATSGDPEDIALITELIIPGAQPRWASDAVADADVVVLAIPLHGFLHLDPALLNGKLVIDAMNYWPASDGVLETFEDGGSSEIVAQRLAGLDRRQGAQSHRLPRTRGPGAAAGRHGQAGRRCRGRRRRGGRHDRGSCRQDRLRPGPSAELASGPGAAARRASVRGRADAT